MVDPKDPMLVAVERDRLAPGQYSVNLASLIGTRDNILSTATFNRAAAGPRSFGYTPERRPNETPKSVSFDLTIEI
jgi:hypothetical protein